MEFWNVTFGNSKILILRVLDLKFKVEVLWNNIYYRNIEIRRNFMSNITENDTLLTLNEVAKILKIGRAKAYELPKIVGFPAIKIGRQYRVLYSDLIQWLGTMKQSA